MLQWPFTVVRNQDIQRNDNVNDSMAFYINRMFFKRLLAIFRLDNSSCAKFDAKERSVMDILNPKEGPLSPVK